MRICNINCFYNATKQTGDRNWLATASTRWDEMLKNIKKKSTMQDDKSSDLDQDHQALYRT